MAQFATLAQALGVESSAWTVAEPVERVDSAKKAIQLQIVKDAKYGKSK
jgi:hypothetical protein